MASAEWAFDNDPLELVDSNFKQFDTSDLCVVDASMFREIPGFFIALPIDMIREKAIQANLDAV